MEKGDYSLSKEKWFNPLSILGQRILSRQIKGEKIKSYIKYCEQAIFDENIILASDIVASLMRIDGIEIEFSNLTISDGHMTELDVSRAKPKNLYINSLIIEQIIFPNFIVSGLSITDCIIQRVYGISKSSGLPNWISNSSVDSFESIENVSAIKNSNLTSKHKILVTILKKTFFQKGMGRQEESLLRGLGQVDSGNYTQRILSYLISNGLLEKTKGDHGNIYVPVIKHKNRIGDMLAKLNVSEDEIWRFVSGL